MKNSVYIIILALSFTNPALPMEGPCQPPQKPNTPQATTQQFHAGLPDLRPEATPLQILGLPENATLEAAKRAHFVLTFVFDPNKFERNKSEWAKIGVTTKAEAHAASARINEAWNQLNR